MVKRNEAVFFYGLFMDATLLVSKGVHAGAMTTAYVDGYRLRIGERATLVPEPGSRAYGVVTEASPKEIAALYADASVADYIAETVHVVLCDGRDMPARCYNLPADRLRGANPQYAEALLALATRIGLPGNYLEQIRRAADKAG